MLKFFLFLAFLFSCFGFYQFWAASRLPIISVLPNFQAVSSVKNETLTKEGLSGRIWVSGFLFTRCGGPCPLLMSKMVKLSNQLPKEIGFAVFTVDPEYDDSLVMAEYAKHWPIQNLDQWLFVSGKRKELYRLYQEGFKISPVEEPGAQESSRFIHTTNLVLLDSKAQVRGYYATTDDLFIENLKKDIKKLLLQGS